MIEFVFNGMVFILLGLQFPHIIGRALLDAHETSNVQVWLLIGYIAAVAGALYAMRSCGCGCCAGSRAAAPRNKAWRMRCRVCARPR